MMVKRSKCFPHACSIGDHQVDEINNGCQGQEVKQCIKEKHDMKGIPDIRYSET